MPHAYPFRQTFARLRPFAAFALVVGLATLVGGQPPANPLDKAKEQKEKEAAKSPFPDEVEDPNAPKTRKSFPIEDEGPPPVTVPKGALFVRIEDLYRAANDAKVPAVRDILARYTVAYDRLIDASDRPIRILPIPIHNTEKFPERFGVFELAADNSPRTLRGFDIKQMKKIEHFEDLALVDAAALADIEVGSRPRPIDAADAADRLIAAEKLLADVIWFHDAARDQNKRRGKGWEPVKIKLTDQLAVVRGQRLKLAVKRKDWPTVRQLGARMTTLYPNNAKLMEDVFAARLAEAEATVQASEQAADLERARDAVSEFEAKYPMTKNEAAARVRDALKTKARRLFDRAEAAVKAESAEARNLLRLVELVDPEFPGLRKLQAEMKSGYTVLYVGVNQLPERMSPALARFDSEHMAVELMFEPLLEALPDETHGVRYRPALAAAMPAPGALVRDVTLTRSVEWTGEGRGQIFDAGDVAGTLKLLRAARHTWSADGVEWLDDQTRVDDLSRVRIAYSIGHPYPLSLLNFKLLPARYLASKNKSADDTEFALRPFGTGPFRFQEKNDKQVVFVANPLYARRPGHLGQPYIREVRFIESAKIKDPVAAFKAEQLHVLTDVPTAEIGKFTAAGAGLQGKVVVATASSNDRIHVLAVNHRKPALQSAALRRGLSHAIDRETILKEVYREGYTDYHRPLAGPFPPKSWATPKPLGGEPPALFNKDLAQAKFADHFKSQGAANLILYYPSDDPRAKRACERIKKMVEEAGVGDNGKITLNLEGVPTPELIRRVKEEAAFDLAFLPFDYPTDLYPLGLSAFLDPTATGKGGRNYMAAGVKANNPGKEDEALGRALAEARQHADPAKLAQKAQDVFTRFNEAMPFIPLWQLDRHVVLSTAVKLAFDDRPEPAQAKWLPPTTLFAGIARWRIE